MSSLFILVVGYLVRGKETYKQRSSFLYLWLNYIYIRGSIFLVYDLASVQIVSKTLPSFVKLVRLDTLGFRHDFLPTPFFSFTNYLTLCVSVSKSRHTNY